MCNEDIKDVMFPFIVWVCVYNKEIEKLILMDNLSSRYVHCLTELQMLTFLLFNTYVVCFQCVLRDWDCELIVI